MHKIHALHTFVHLFNISLIWGSNIRFPIITYNAEYTFKNIYIWNQKCVVMCTPRTGNYKQNSIARQQNSIYSNTDKLYMQLFVLIYYSSIYAILKTQLNQNTLEKMFMFSWYNFQLTNWGKNLSNKQRTLITVIYVGWLHKLLHQLLFLFSARWGFLLLLCCFDACTFKAKNEWLNIFVCTIWLGIHKE